MKSKKNEQNKGSEVSEDHEDQESTYIKDLTELVERTQKLEKNIGIKIDRLYAQIERGPFSTEYIINVFGEIRPSNGVIQSDMLEIVIDALDKKGRIIGRDSTIGIDNLTEFQSFDLRIYVPEIPERIRLYPKNF